MSLWLSLVIQVCSPQEDSRHLKGKESLFYLAVEIKNERQWVLRAAVSTPPSRWLLGSKSSVWAEEHRERAALAVYTRVLVRVKAHLLPCFPIIPWNEGFASNDGGGELHGGPEGAPLRKEGGKHLSKLQVSLLTPLLAEGAAAALHQKHDLPGIQPAWHARLLGGAGLQLCPLIAVSSITPCSTAKCKRNLNVIWMLHGTTARVQRACSKQCGCGKGQQPCFSFAWVKARLLNLLISLLH